MTTCKSCNESITGNYCSNCGNPIKLKRIDGHYIVHEIEHILHFEKGILFTVKELFIHPGKNIKEFLSENRVRLVKPIIFIIITSLIYSFINHYFHIEERYINIDINNTKSYLVKINQWVQSHYGYANLIMGMFIALWIKVFFKKYDYNFYEILILLCFVMGMSMLIFSFFAILQGFIHVKLLGLAGVLGILYCSFAIADFFDRSKKINYLKALASYILGMLTFSIGILALGTLLDTIFKNG